MTDKLIKGFEDFKRYQYEGDSALMPALVENGQSPKYFIISCIDSRSNPGTIFRAPPGTFFAHKAMGAIVRPYKKGTALAAALQFALNYNDVDTIVVLGHTQCGAMKALVENIEDEEISEFISVAQNALQRAEAACDCCDEDIQSLTEKEALLESVQNLKRYPSVEKALGEERVIIKPWLFDMKAGDLLEFNEDKGEFIVITTHETKEDSRQHA